jgi:hypothetical protein
VIDRLGILEAGPKRKRKRNRTIDIRAVNAELILVAAVSPFLLPYQR